MIALILNSGLGRRMGEITYAHPKCMTEVAGEETILSRQLRQLARFGIQRVVITTGLFSEALQAYVSSLELPLQVTYVHNPLYETTNYIYSMELAGEALDDSLLLMHGDLVFTDSVLERVLNASGSVMAVSAEAPLPEKDFKAVIREGRITRIGVDCFEKAVAAQPLYRLEKEDWWIWREAIHDFCSQGQTDVYAENAFNAVAGRMLLRPLDVGGALCGEIDTPAELQMMREKLAQVHEPLVYVCFSTDIIHNGHLNLLANAAALGRVMVGVLCDEAVASYKRYPILNFDQRRQLIAGLRQVSLTVPQQTLSYRANIAAYRPDYVVHGDDWQSGFQKPIRDEVEQLLVRYGGQLREFPYTQGRELEQLEKASRAQLAMPDVRRGRLRQLLRMKPLLCVIEAHSGITGLIAEKTTVLQEGKTYQFDAMWVSSLCDSTAKGKPDIELVDMTSRLRTIDDIMEVTTKPIILDGDTGGQIEHFVYNIRTLERIGVSAVIIEDKTGFKLNSLFGTEVPQTQDTIENFCQKIRAGKRALKTREFMLIARIESLILERGMDDALTRAFAYVAAGADGIMIHSRRREADEIFAFVKAFREKDQATPLVVVPTSFNQITEEEFRQRGINMVIYANQLTRSGFPAMQQAARRILTHHRAQEADEMCMPIKEILNLIPQEDQ